MSRDINLPSVFFLSNDENIDDSFCRVCYLGQANTTLRVILIRLTITS